MKEKIRHFIESRPFQHTIIVLIVINAIFLGFETSRWIMNHLGGALKAVDAIILKIFVIEIALRLFVYRKHFFKCPWSLFDFLIVIIALVPLCESFAVLRALRILRVLRLISAVSSMRRVIEGLLSAIPGIASVSTIMLLLFYIFAVMGTHLYGETFPNWFGSLGKTIYTLFQIMTLESWSMGIVRPVMEQHPNAWAFFVVYILATTFTVLNLFIAIIVNAMHQGADEQAKEDRIDIKEALGVEMKEMEQRLIKAMNQKNSP
jgi:voltage-gated sodium channel